VVTLIHYCLLSSYRWANIIIVIIWCTTKSKYSKAERRNLHLVKKKFNSTLDVVGRFVRLDDDTKSLNSAGPTHSTEYYVTCHVHTQHHSIQHDLAVSDVKA